MALKKFKPTPLSRRFFSVVDYSGLSKVKPHKSLTKAKTRTGGRNNQGVETNINKGGGAKKKYRLIDFKRSDKVGIPAKVETIEYDPNRTAFISRICFRDGERRYILAPEGLKVGDIVESGELVDIKIGNSLPLKNIPVGLEVHNVELKLGKGGALGRAAGTSIQIVGKDDDYVLLKMPSGELRKIHGNCYATIGRVSNIDWNNVSLGKAGRNRWRGRRPHTRGIAKNPVDHPMGGRTPGGKHPSTPTGKPTKGLKTRKNKRTDRFIVRDRRSTAELVIA
ncbi:MAG: 50S ribosomal protein L2 [Deltaproteobacteria bacterium]|nr:50S ribosomal protein L2 [Deltaproteobacteria bacterium]